jgi:hypothetical protein
MLLPLKAMLGNHCYDEPRQGNAPTERLVHDICNAESDPFWKRLPLNYGNPPFDC